MDLTLTQTSFKKAVAVTAIPLLLCACNGNDGDGDGDNTEEFDRTAMLANYGDNLIVPAYENYATAVATLSDKMSDLVAIVTVENLDAAQSAYADAAVAWQAVAAYNFGPATSNAILANTNTYPTDTAVINSQISSGNFALDAIANTDAIGFPALDYLLFKLDDAAIIDHFADTANYADYASAVVAKMKTESEVMLSDWKTDDYLTTFKEATGTDIGSGLGLMVNGLNQYFETHLRDGKVAIPIGVRTLGEILPERAEGYFSRVYAYDFLSAAVDGLEDLYMGGSGVGLDDHLVGVNAAELDQVIQNQIDKIQDLVAGQAGELVDDVVNYDANLTQIHAELQQLAVLLKVDMSSRLGVLITYQDNDGD